MCRHVLSGQTPYVTRPDGTYQANPALPHLLYCMCRHVLSGQTPYVTRPDGTYQANPAFPNISPELGAGPELLHLMHRCARPWTLTVNAIAALLSSFSAV